MGLALILGGFLVATFLMVVAKRITALIAAFRLQSLCLFLYVFGMALTQKHFELFVVSALVLVLKAVLIPFLLARIVRRIKVEEDLGLIVNPQVSLAVALLLTYLSYVFARSIIVPQEALRLASFVVSLAAFCAGFFIMASRMKALAQVLGLLAMENGIFLAAAAIAGGMPFFAELALFFDIFIFVIIIELFVYKVNRLFTHIDTSKMDSLKG
ncbi:MAG: hypothetical protein PHR11_02005 [Candidatus Omnitrophica bacterium]|nr:hypothetical protein [Candidatus Omnitrophota bacterium]